MSIPDSSHSASRIDLSDGLEQVSLFAPMDGPAKVTWSLSEQIANSLVEEIIRGTLAPGQQLQEVALSQRFGVSRGPVREAFRIVEKEGLINIRPRYGAFVAKLSAKNIADIFEVRALLLALAARRIAERPTDTVLADLRQGTARLEAAVDSAERFLPIVYQCSMYVAAKIDNDLARGILLSLARQTLHLTRVALLDKASRQLWIGNWTKMVQAAAHNEPARAEAAMRSIVDNVGRAVLQALGEVQGSDTDETEPHV
jgi:DNA-binding GntR family transcriptional regulator